jgi:hypothetical protein
MADHDRAQTVDQDAILNVQPEPKDKGDTAAAEETLAAEPTEATSISSVSASSLEPDVSSKHNQTT